MNLDMVIVLFAHYYVILLLEVWDLYNAYNGSLLAVRSGLHSCVSLDKDIPFLRITIDEWLSSAAMAASMCCAFVLFS